MPAAFVITQQGVRRDGRSSYDGRELDIHLERGDDAATAEVALGNTRVIARASCEVGAPDTYRPNEGLLRVKVDGAPRARDDDDEDDRNAVVHEARRFLERTYRDGGALDVEALCVVGGEACWQVSLNVSLLVDRGNALEALTLAAGAALRHVRCRVATGAADGSVALADVDSVVPLPIPLTRSLVAVQVVVSPLCRTPCADPDRAEEAAAAVAYVAGLDAHGELGFAASGGAGLDRDALETCLGLAKARATQLHARLDVELETADAAWTQRRIELARTNNVVQV